jgi:hypothetical protein
MVKENLYFVIHQQQTIKLNHQHGVKQKVIPTYCQIDSTDVIKNDKNDYIYI